MSLALPNQRHLFDIPDHVSYLNAAALGPLPRCSVAAGTAGLARKAQPWDMTSAEFFTDTKRLRPKLAQLIGADTEGIAFCASASYGLATAARNLDVRSDQSILTLADQFPSNIYVWRDLAAQTGAHVQTVGDAETNQSLSDQILSAIGPKTAIVACPQVRWTDGARLDLEAIGARARDVGAALVLDLSQSCGAMPFDVRTVKPDFAVCVGYKWLLGPYSAGFMYAAPHRRGGVPLEHNWISREGAADFTKLTEYTDRFAPGAERYDMGERSNFALLPALEASLDLLLDFGIDAIEATLAEKTAGLSDALEEIGLPCPPEAERGAHYLGATLPETAPGDLVQRLAALDVHVSRRANCLRITPHIYNTQDDLDRCIAALLDTLAVKS